MTSPSVVGCRGIWVIDAFTAVPFRGNPAAVCLLESEAPEAWMQSVAAEMNLSETAFVVGRTGGGRFGLRWFTPQVEVDLCGHATLASAHMLWSEGHVEADRPVVFETRVSGELTCVREGDRVWMDFPSRAVAACPAPAGLLEALGCGASAVVGVGQVLRDYLVELADADAVRRLKPDAGALRRLPLRAVMVTARGGGEGVDFVSRFFGPGVGIDEDPVTGSAHCALAPYWAERLGRVDLRAKQVSARGGELRLRVRGGRVEMGGQAVTVTRGVWLAG